MGTEIIRNSCPVTDINALPENCIANVLSLTSPPDSCRLSLVASTFRFAAESDSVWERFMPSDYEDMIARASDSSSPLVFASKKELYLRLCDHPLIIDGGTMSFSLDKWSGKKCFMLSARYLTIGWGDTPDYWRWTSLPETESRFTEVAELVDVCWLEICGKISTQMLSPDTTYAAYLVFKWTTRIRGFGHRPAEGWVGISGSEGKVRSFYLNPDGWQRQRNVPRQRGLLKRGLTNMLRRVVAVPRESYDQYPKERGDGWLEMELGEHLNKSGEDGELDICMRELGSNWKSGLILQGIEIRPKSSKEMK